MSDEAATAIAGEEIRRYAGGVHLGDDPGTATPVIPITADLPKVVRRYLLPTENDRNIIVIRQHWAILGWQLAALGGAIIFGVVVNALLYEYGKASVWPVRLIWAPVPIALIWYIAHAADWHTRWIVVTPQRIMTVGGLIRRNIIPLPMKRARDVELYYSFPGRLLGYASMRTQSFGTDHQLAVIRFVPDPDTVFNVIWRILLPGEGGAMPGDADEWPLPDEAA